MPRGIKTKELWKNSEYRKRMQDAHRGQQAWNKGIPHSKEAKERMSDVKKGKHYSPKTEFKPKYFIKSKQCIVCLKVFSGPAWKLRIQKLCSRKCFRGYTWPNSKKVEKKCEICKKSFKIYPAREHTARFCSRKCFGLSNRGEKHRNYKGIDVSKRDRAMGQREYRIWRKKIKERDNNRCNDCKRKNGENGVSGLIIEVDHIKPYSLYPKLRYKVKNGRVLCRDCHKKTDTYGFKLLHNKNFSRRNCG